MEKKKRKFNLSELGGYYITPSVVMKSDKISSPAKRVLCYLMTLWTSTDGIHPSVGAIASITDQGERSVKYALKELTDHKLIKVVQRGNGSGHSNTYAVNASGINKFFGCEILIDETKKQDEKKAAAPKTTNKETTTQVSNKTIGKDTVVGDPLAWMNTEYFRKAREENEN